MYKNEFMEIIECIVSGSKNAFNNDKPKIRQLFNDTLDAYEREGLIHSARSYYWILTERELNKLLKIAKG